jgi:RNA polymerase primary sigma factor
MSKALTLSKTIRSNWDEDVMFYLNNIRGYEVLSPDEEVAVFEKIKNGTEEEKTKARQLIMASNQRFVYSLAKEYAKGKDIMEIVQIATIGMEKAIDKFDVTLGMRFMSYAVWYMRREILQSFNGESQMVRTANKQKLMGALPKIKEKFFQENQRDPQPEEIIEILDKEYNIKIKETEDTYDLTVSSISDTMVGDSDAPSPTQLEYDVQTASRNDYEDEIDREADSYLVDRLLSVCTEKEQKIMRMLYGIGYENPFSPEDVAEYFGMTKTRIMQIKKNLIKKMQKASMQMR